MIKQTVPWFYPEVIKSRHILFPPELWTVTVVLLRHYTNVSLALFLSGFLCKSRSQEQIKGFVACYCQGEADNRVTWKREPWSPVCVCVGGEGAWIQEGLNTWLNNCVRCYSALCFVFNIPYITLFYVHIYADCFGNKFLQLNYPLH